jgi:hypothetical protein
VERVGSVRSRCEDVAVFVERQLAHLGAALQPRSLTFENLDRVVEGDPSGGMSLGVLHDAAPTIKATER